MNRLLVFVLCCSMSTASTAFAAGNLLQSAVKAGEQAGKAVPATTSADRLLVRSNAVPANAQTAPVLAQQQAGTTLEGSRMGKGKKLLIGIGIGLGFAATAYAIDHGVENDTPSSRGNRPSTPF